MYTKIKERVKTIASSFLLFERCILGIEFPKFSTRRLTKLEPNEIFNDFALSREPFDEIDSFFILKVWTRK